ncbi:hypothetical protein E2C01_043183 [Portunus trituberculatus]|uniref:Uncharacterized protein n=1 Tax=Portunus trituberculatus TaxID=210409 RepID=A0A5B7FYV0_PORTR|nr:hypothetical protein [Portunus trituberculatus]
MGRVKIKHPRPKEIDTRSKLLQLMALEMLSLPSWPWTKILMASFRKRCSGSFLLSTSLPSFHHNRDLGGRFFASGWTTSSTGMRQRSSERRWSRSNTVKITFCSSEMARRACSEGLLLFSMSVPPHQIREETYTPLLMCNICYTIEDHSTRQCPCPQGYKVCSECGSRDYTFRECTSPSKHCLHCGQAHSCMAMRCPLRKQALKEKEATARTESTRVANTTYAQAVSPPANEGSAGLNLTALVCVMLAYMVNCAEPGSFQATLSASLAMNGLPDVKLPPNPLSQAIISAITRKMGPVQGNENKSSTAECTPHSRTADGLAVEDEDED